MARLSVRPHHSAKMLNVPADTLAPLPLPDTIYASASSSQFVCGCLYVGTQQAYNQCKRDQQQRHLADEQALNAQLYADSAWNWNVWGPWGPGYGWGYGGRIGW
jgi:hypothetical protein